MQVTGNVPGLLPHLGRNLRHQGRIDLALELSQHIGAQLAIHIAQDGIAVRNGRQILARALDGAPRGRGTQEHIPDHVGGACIAGGRQGDGLAQTRNRHVTHVTIGQAERGGLAHLNLLSVIGSECPYFAEL